MTASPLRPALELLPALAYLACGFGEWILYGLRLRASLRGWGALVCLVVVVEVWLGLWVFRSYAAGADAAGLLYAAGCGVGAWVGVSVSKVSQVSHNVSHSQICDPGKVL